MAKIHHMALKSAVAKYSPLLEKGATEEEIKKEIAGDEKKFDSDAVNEIYQSIVGKPNGTYLVVNEFHDIADWLKIHKPGDDVSHFDSERLEKLVKNGHVEKQ